MKLSRGRLEGEIKTQVITSCCYIHTIKKMENISLRCRDDRCQNPNINPGGAEGGEKGDKCLSAAEGVNLLARSRLSISSADFCLFFAFLQELENKEKKLKRQQESHPKVTRPFVVHTRSMSEHLRSSRNATFLFLFLVQLSTSVLFFK